MNWTNSSLRFGFHSPTNVTINIILTSDHREYGFCVKSRLMYMMNKQRKKILGTLEHYFAPHYSCFGGCLLWAPNNWRFNAIRSSISKVSKSFLYFEVETDAADNTPWIFIQSWKDRHDGSTNDRKQYDSRDSETIKLNKYPRHLSFACVFTFVYLCR